MEDRSDEAEQKQTQQMARIFKALSDPTRLRIVEMLVTHEVMTGTEITESVDISMPLLCHHWTVLEGAGLVVMRKAGQTVYCSLNRELLTDTFQALLSSK